MNQRTGTCVGGCACASMVQRWESMSTGRRCRGCTPTRREVQQERLFRECVPSAPRGRRRREREKKEKGEGEKRLLGKSKQEGAHQLHPPHLPPVCSMTVAVDLFALPTRARTFFSSFRCLFMVVLSGLLLGDRRREASVKPHTTLLCFADQ